MLPLLQARIASIWSILAEFVAEITVLRVDYHAFKLKLTLADGSTTRISERYYRDTLEQYAYYWLDLERLHFRRPQDRELWAYALDWWARHG